jgi:transcriptional regulator with XRE-family HTH domain
MSRRNEPSKTEFGRELLTRRRRARLSQHGLAKLAGVSPSLVNILERGEDYKTGRQLNPSVQTIRKLSEALAVDPFREGEEVAVNDRLRDEIYEALFRAMQYDLPKVSLEDVRQKLISISGNPELVDVTMRGFARVPRASQKEQDALTRASRALFEGFLPPERVELTT